MKPTHEVQPPVSSVLADLRHLPLAQLPALGNIALSDTMRRVPPESPIVTVRVAAFNSAI
jgi:FXSXX-COOH protein